MDHALWHCITTSIFHWIICVEVVQLSCASRVTQSQRLMVSSFQWSVVQYLHFHGPLAKSMPKNLHVAIFGTHRPCIWEFLFPFFVDSFSALPLQRGKAHIEARKTNLRFSFVISYFNENKNSLVQNMFGQGRLLLLDAPTCPRKINVNKFVAFSFIPLEIGEQPGAAN